MATLVVAEMILMALNAVNSLLLPSIDVW